jgi:dienelactone hydrolase
MRDAMLLHVWADVRADARGIVDMDVAQPLAGSYRRPDGFGLLWSGYPRGDEALPKAVPADLYGLDGEPAGTIVLRLERSGSVVSSATFRVIEEAAETRFESVARPGLNGVFAARAGGRRLPTVLVLHGSEGGNAVRARAAAAYYAARGFAALAINYFAWPYERVPELPVVHMNVSVETIEHARDWLAGRPEVDGRRIGIVGASKGAEFALVAASRYDWITAVVACVPSDVVWQGYGRDVSPEERASSWSVSGVPVPYVPLYRESPERPFDYVDNTARYERSRRDHPAEASAARIPVERSNAQFLLIGSDRDEVWASGRMIRTIVESMGNSGKGANVRSLIFPTAGHQVCGVGSSPIRLYSSQSSDPAAKDVTDEGEAATRSERARLEFLTAALR